MTVKVMETLVILVNAGNEENVNGLAAMAAVCRHRSRR